MPRKELSVQPREVTGKKVATLRRAGMLPANIYGHGIDSVSVQVSIEELARTLKASTANEVIDVNIAGEPAARPVVIQRVQRHPLTSLPLHADLYQVSLREKMRADVPIVIIGRSNAIDTYNGVLVNGIETLHIEALPLDIPARVEVDISILRELEAAVHVRDLKLAGNVTILNDPDVVVVKIASPAVASEEDGTATATMAGETTAESEEGASDEAEPASEGESAS